MHKILCSVGILTYNSDATLRRTLESVKDIDDIIVCDGGSTDTTRTLAREYGARVINQSPQCLHPDGSIADFACAKNQLINAARHAYLLLLDSDEAASPELCKELQRIAATGIEDGYRVPIRMWWNGQMIERAANYPGYQYRIVRVDRGVRMVKAVHERPAFVHSPGPASTLAAPWYVYLDDTFVHQYMKRNRKYVELELASLHPLPFSRWFSDIMPRNLRTIASIILKTLWNRLRYPGAVHMPLAVEWGRIQYHVALIVDAVANICRL